MRKKYIKPTFKARKVIPIMELCNASGHHDNGNHYGWDNPHNPHYPHNNPDNPEED